MQKSPPPKPDEFNSPVLWTGSTQGLVMLVERGEHTNPSKIRHVIFFQAVSMDNMHKCMVCYRWHYFTPETGTNIPGCYFFQEDNCAIRPMIKIMEGVRSSNLKWHNHARGWFCWLQLLLIEYQYKRSIGDLLIPRRAFVGKSPLRQ
jgi:hypothetical protein